MIQFAMLVENNVVQQINLVDDSVCLNNDGTINEQLGIDFMKKLYGENSKWVMSSPHGIFRGKPAMSGDIYDEIQDKFVIGPNSTIVEDIEYNTADYEVE